MEKSDLLLKLNWFYSLEAEQVDLYKKQSLMVSDEYISRILMKISEVEKGHVENIAALIEKLGGTPTIIGEVVGELIGKTSGTMLGMMSLEQLLKANIALEKKAMEDYKNLIIRVGREDVFETLWNNLLEEDMHTAWMHNKMEELAQSKKLRV